MLFSISNMSNNNYYLNRHGFNPSSRATYANLYPSTTNFYTTMSVGVPYLFIQSKDNGNTSLHPSLYHSIALIPSIILIIRNISEPNLMFKLRFMVSEILENTQLFLTNPSNSSGSRQIIIWRPPDNSSGGRQIILLATAR